MGSGQRLASVFPGQGEWAVDSALQPPGAAARGTSSRPG